MAPWKARLAVLAAALWWGSLTAVGFLVVPMLFASLGSPAQAGQMAAKLFAAQTWVGVGCGMLLLMASSAREDAPRMDWGNGALVYVLAGMLLALLQEFAVAPRIVLRQDLALWHGAGTAMYAAQWLCALVVLWRLTRPATSSPTSA
ncbi:DUF4149 domain-containing protein [Ramlibacter paludis]|uniref:DUF4149 domain-containing protein n=1 Tax=Ramlibacter paludis TaxID=2908000 RepID=UPI003D2CDF4A